MAKRKPIRAKAAKAAAKKSTRAKAAGARKSAKRSTKAAKKSVKRTSARKTTRKAAKKATRQVVARKAAASKSAKRAAKAAKAVKAKAVRKVTTKKKAAPRAKAPAAVASPRAAAPPAAPAPAKAPRPKRAPTLDRARKTVDPSTGSASPRARSRGDNEPHGVPSSLDLDPQPSAARSGGKELADRLKQHTSTGPAITAGDVDADWEEAESVGDEAPGGDNPTPDQDVVDDIGRALGVEYDDDEELKGGDEIANRDKHRWELDPASSDDYDERD